MTGRLIRTLLVAVIVWAGFVYATGRAWDVEHARAGVQASGRVPAAYAGGTTRPATLTHVSVWIRMADCESGDGDGRPPYRATWHYRGRHHGGLQFLPATWNAAKRLSEVRRFAARYAYAYHAPAWVQIAVADNWRRHTSWLQWPTCSRKLGLR